MSAGNLSAVRCTAANAAPSSPGKQYWSGQNSAIAEHVDRA
jgi:hypothetical protein